MKRMDHRKKNVGKVVTGMLIGSVVGAAVGWLTAPAAGSETRRRLAGQVKGVREKIGTAEGNLERRARELAGKVNETVEPGGRIPVPS